LENLNDDTKAEFYLANEIHQNEKETFSTENFSEEVEPMENRQEQVDANEQNANNNEQNQAEEKGEEEEEEEEEEDDEDMVKIVISDIVNKPYSQAGQTATAQAGSSLLRQKSKTGLTTTAATATGQATTATVNGQTVVSSAIGTNVTKPTAPQTKGVDLEAPGMINDQPTYDYDLQEVKDEDKPWRKPGADITDYFNYGFNEETWIAYCMKQKRLRAENTTLKVSF
jgi:pre-mRNA 3'-end-processing factor FIP1